MPDLLHFIELKQYPETLFNIKIDLVRKAAIRPEIRQTVLSEAVKV